MKKFYDIVFVGGGLANSLAAHRLKNVRPDVEFLLLEQNATYAGNYTWSFLESNLTALEWSWVAPLVSKTWGATTVRFPQLIRTLPHRYHAVRSSHLNDVLNSELTYQVGQNKKVVDVTPTQVILEDGFTVQASCVIDGRGWQATTAVKEGFQKLFGMHLSLKNQHGLEHPLLLDATVKQAGGAHFFSVLPWDKTRLLVENIYYSEMPFLQPDQMRGEIEDYVEKQGWLMQSVEREEYGVLPLPLEGSLDWWTEGVPLSGMRGGFFNATTSNAFAYAVRFADALAHMKTFEAKKVFALTKKWARQHWCRQSFYRCFNRKMFRGLGPEIRYRAWEKLYRQPESRLARFYRGQLSWWDKLNIWFGTASNK